MSTSGKFDTQADAILDFYRNLRPRLAPGDGIEIMNPYKDTAAWAVTKQFYPKYYNDNRSRFFIFGINPGRHGAGLTGIPFTDPIRLAAKCGIANDFPKRGELSSEFVYEVIDAFGGPAAFYGRYHFTALSPLGFVRDGRNLNYYDDKTLLKSFEPFMLRCIRRQLETMPTFPVCYCLGEGENYKYFGHINHRHRFFERIIPLPHPRWVMQYRRKKIGEYVRLYQERLSVSGPPEAPAIA
ncbi:MAG TPA: uracil-DNA glycosylase family protein [Puia sp.]|nr:uracil-DNA glycosylase family protein [Puia sp.]